jgi:hypothetical protein
LLTDSLLVADSFSGIPSIHLKLLSEAANLLGCVVILFCLPIQYMDTLGIGKHLLLFPNFLLKIALFAASLILPFALYFTSLVLRDVSLIIIALLVVYSFGIYITALILIAINRLKTNDQRTATKMLKRDRAYISMSIATASFILTIASIIMQSSPFRNDSSVVVMRVAEFLISLPMLSWVLEGQSDPISTWREIDLSIEVRDYQ